MLPKIYNATMNLRRTKSQLAVKEMMVSMVRLKDAQDGDLKKHQEDYLARLQEEIDYLKSKIVKQEKRINKLSIT